MRIRTQFLAVLAAVTLVPLIAAGVFMYRASVARLHAQSDLGLKTLARRVASEVDAFVYRSREGVRSDALIPALSAFLAAAPATQAAERLGIAQLLREAVISDPVNFSSCALFDRAGRKLVETAPSLEDFDESGEEWIRGPLTSGLPAIVSRREGPGGPALWFSAPVRDGTGAILGVLRLRCEPAAVQQIVSHLSVDTGDSAYALVIDQRNRLLAQDTSLPAVDPARLPLPIMAPPAQRAASQVVTLNWAGMRDGEPPARVAFVPLVHARWLVAVVQTSAAYNANAIELSRSLLTLGGLIVALILVSGLVAATTLVRPVARLAAAAESFGTGHAATEVPERGATEVRTLARAFNRMTRQLRATLADLEQRITEARSSEDQLRDVLDFSPIGIVVTDADRNVQLVNRRFTELFGYTAADLRTIDDWWPRAYPDAVYRRQVQAEWQARVAEAMAAGRDMRPMQAIVTTPDGRRRRVEFRFKQVGPRRINLLSDVTENERTELALRESEERFRMLVENSGELIALLDPEGRFLYASPNHRALTGYEPDELVGRRMSDFIPPEDLPAEDLPRRFQEPGGPVQHRLRRRDGAWRWFATSGRLFISSLGEARAVVISRDVTRQREDVERLAASEQRFATIFSSSPTGLVITEFEDGTILDVNLSACRMVGARREEIVGRRSTDFTAWPPGSRERLIEEVRTGHPVGVEVPLRRAEGPGPTVLAQFISIELEGRPRLLVALSDITASKVHERVRQFLLGGAVGKAFFEQLAVEAATLLGAVRVFISRIGRGPEETLDPLIVWDRGRLVPSQTRAASGGPSEAILRRGEFAYWPNVRAEFPHRAARYVEWGVASYAGIALRTAAGRNVGTIGVMFERPVADAGLVRSVLQIFAARAAIELERLQSEDILRESEERFRLLVENSSELVVEISTEGRYLYASPNHEQITGYAPAELVGRSVFDLIHPADRPAVLAKIQSREATGRYRYLRKDGFWRWFESSGRAFQTSLGEVHGVIVTRDVTEQIESEEVRKTLETQLRQAQKMEAIGTLAGGIAHDFNNILTGIMGNLQLIELDLPPGHNVGPLLADAQKASHRARDLVAQILTFSRRQEQQRAPTRLGPVVEEALRLLRATLPATIEIRTDLDPECPPVHCDGSQFHQVIMNLGTNAAHAIGDRRGVISVTLQTVEHDAETLARHPQVLPGQTVALSISDTGCGMDAATLERIFEPFFTTKGPGAGTGLGLPVVHGIVQDHHGALVVESRPGEGTTFDLYLPPASGEASAAVPAPTVLFHGSGERILVVDDEAAVARVATSLLQRLGYVAENFTAPEAALEAFRAAPGGYEAVLTDLTMPGLTGIDLAREIRTIRPGMPVIITSGFLGTKATEAAQALGIIHYVRKPYSLQTLSVQLRQALAG
ncbi:MAG: PAS domain S-box protein [Opitutaceae bacterium]|nr:PAS domain S-box protein [Opitutaceae bacterium]